MKNNNRNQPTIRYDLATEMIRCAHYLLFKCDRFEQESLNSTCRHIMSSVYEQQFHDSGAKGNITRFFVQVRTITDVVDLW